MKNLLLTLLKNHYKTEQHELKRINKWSSTIKCNENKTEGVFASDIKL